ncbi:MAG TPA: M14 family zinc carboxypeptidase [Phycisphaerales bacterium]|nr:M14 family zinc carboxypeptidase [Phycisphaerales bacterium]
MRRFPRTVIAAAVIVSAPAALAQDSTQPTAPVETFQVGRSADGRAISGWRLGRAEPDEMGLGPDQRPALLIVAGLDGRHDFGSRLALTLVDRIVTGHAELLDHHTIYIVPDLNPDNDALFDRPGAPRADFGRAPRPVDADGDGRAGEDPADDLNEDGLITRMRVRNPPPRSGLTPTLVADPEDPRVLRAPDEKEGEIAEYALLVEGLDNDGDGRFNEDGIAGSAGGGVDLDSNFPSLWPEHKDGSGVVPLSEPETRSLVEWMLSRDNIVCALAITTGDNILNTPAAGKHAPDGREPTGIEEGDQAAYARVQEIFKEITSQTGAPSREWAGSFTQWAYAQFGVYSFATPGWVRPDLVKPQQEGENKGDAAPAGGDAGAQPTEQPDPDAERKALRERGVPDFLIEFITATPQERAAIVTAFGDLSEQERADRMAAVEALPEDLQLRVRALISGQPDPAAQAGRARPGPGGREGGGRQRGGDEKPSESGDAEWLKYSDEHLQGAGFIEWRPFEHPQLGEVEIGGLAPGIRHSPPEAEWDRVAEEQTRFVVALLGLMPSLDVEVAETERLAAGLWRIRVRAVNRGELPTTSAIGVKARRLAPIVVSVAAELDDIVAGQAVQRWDAIGGHGAHADAEWIIRAPDGATVEIEVRSNVFGDRTLSLSLEENE